jgi:hypothetical protein
MVRETLNHLHYYKTLNLPFSFKRLQFFVKVSFGIRINEAQSQKCRYVGVDTCSECFSYGKLYMEFS